MVCDIRGSYTWFYKIILVVMTILWAPIMLWQIIILLFFICMLCCSTCCSTHAEVLMLRCK